MGGGGGEKRDIRTTKGKAKENGEKLAGTRESYLPHIIRVKRGLVCLLERHIVTQVERAVLPGEAQMEEEKNPEISHPENHQSRV